MRKVIFLLLAVLLIIGVAACGHEVEIPEEIKNEPPVTVTVEGTGEPEPEEPAHIYIPGGNTAGKIEQHRGAALPQGGILAVSGDHAAFVSQQGGIILADLPAAGYQYLSGNVASEIYFDGKQVYYTGDDGIYALDMGGEIMRLSENLSYALWVENGKIYYIRQTDLHTETPNGELWCMNSDGSGAVMILGTRIKGDFCIKDGWVYYTSAEDGALYRSMLYGSQIVKLADGPVKLCFVTERGVYYKEQSGRMTLRRIDLRTNVNISLGAYGEFAVVGDTIVVMARRESAVSGLDNQFTLMTFDDRTQEQAVLLVFENVGADSLGWLQENYVYMHRDGGGVYRMALDDALQTKEELFSGDAVFTEGRAWHITEKALEIYDCATLETVTIKLN